ncbi:ribosome biogenesis GTP-binding protein [Candidatus Phytoplasma mali]|uniref:Probable GTP-binding protein EngB n=1 Tax=Phytoplasma mali (strain AT) TaxID=482235 RepID=B3R0C5_PHYMT|nr:ribosome biogenesis GTP-binding protein YihA/YsxC [Candidatus Phytoplasma mali]CAP18289.1 ribosome biogenesis GTP-binding protein [Candidatus Phytoplasma mali]
MIKQAIFIKSIAQIKDTFSLIKHPEIILIGKSNVGKSSFINNLTGQKKLARVSKNPGKTITLNYYLLNNFFYLIDTPGYGYARISKQIKKNFLIIIFDLLKNNLNYRKILYLIDFKVGPNANDINICGFLIKNGFEIVLVFTKKDKINKTKIQQQLIKIQNNFNNFNISCDNFFLISNKNKEGIVEITNFILKNVK